MSCPTTEVSRVAVDTQPPVARISLNNPPLNVIDIPLMEELSSALEEACARPDVSVVILQGAGTVFSAGVDVAAHTPDNVSNMLTGFHAIMHAIVNSRKVIVAAVQGHALGGGAELAMVCDMVITTANAKWGFPEIKLGCYPPVAVTALAALIGQKQASDLILTGRTINGMEAARIGLATRAVPEGGLNSAVSEVVEQLSKLSPAALGVTKHAMYNWSAIHFDKGIVRAEQIYLEELVKTQDAQEGINAFLEKRQPKWTGK